MNILLDKAGVHTPYILKTTDYGRPMKPLFSLVQIAKRGGQGRESEWDAVCL